MHKTLILSLVFVSFLSSAATEGEGEERELLIPPRPVMHTAVEMPDDLLLIPEDAKSNGSHTSSIELERKTLEINTNKLVCYSGLVSGAVSGGVTFFLWILLTKVWDQKL